MQYATPQAMEAAAVELTHQGTVNARLAALEGENAILRKAQVPAGQKFDSGPGTTRPSGNRQERLTRYVNGETLSDKEIAELFKK